MKTIQQIVGMVCKKKDDIQWGMCKIGCYAGFIRHMQDKEQLTSAITLEKGWRVHMNDKSSNN